MLSLESLSDNVDRIHANFDFDPSRLQMLLKTGDGSVLLPKLIVNLTKPVTGGHQMTTECHLCHSFDKKDICI